MIPDAEVSVAPAERVEPARTAQPHGQKVHDRFHDPHRLGTAGMRYVDSGASSPTM